MVFNVDLSVSRSVSLSLVFCVGEDDVAAWRMVLDFPFRKISKSGSVKDNLFEQRVDTRALPLWVFHVGR